MAKSKKKPAAKKSSSKKSSVGDDKKKSVQKKSNSDLPKTRGRKPKTRPAKRRRGFKAQAAISTKPKRTNRYIIITNSIREYCLRRYGFKCSQEDVLAIYNQLKSRYESEWGKNKPKKDISPAEIANNIDTFLANKDLIDQQPPLDLQQIWWFEIEGKFQQRDSLFFKPDDDFVLDFSSVNMGVHNVKFKDLPKFYRNNLYAAMRTLIEEVEEQAQRDLSPPPSLVYNSKLSNVKARSFYYELDPSDMIGYFDQNVDREIQTPEYESESSATGEQKETEQSKKEKSTTQKSKKSIDTESALKERELKIKEEQNLLEELKIDERLVNLELMTVKEFRKKWSDYLKRKR
jgi:hypothetical protein